VLTNGPQWIFIIVMLDPDGNGAKFKYSETIEFNKLGAVWPDVVVGILLHWVSI